MAKSQITKNLIALAWLSCFQAGWSAEAVSKKVASQFQFLPAGEVKPRGWLQDQIRADVTKGFTPEPAISASPKSPFLNRRQQNK